MGGACAKDNEVVAEDCESRFETTAEERTPSHLDVNVLCNDSPSDNQSSALASLASSGLPRLRLGQDSDREAFSNETSSPLKHHRQELSRLEGERVHLQRQHIFVEREMQKLLAAKAELDETASLQTQRMAVEQEMVMLLAAKAKLESVRNELQSAGEGALTITVSALSVPRLAMPEYHPCDDAAAAPPTPRGARRAEMPARAEPELDASSESLQPPGILPPLIEAIESSEGVSETKASGPALTFKLPHEGSVKKEFGPLPKLETVGSSAQRKMRQLRIPQEEQPPLFTKRGLEVVFLDSGCSARRKYIGQRPLGAKFDRAVHGAHGVGIKISHVSHTSQANDLGLQVGWLVKEVDGQDLSHRSFEDAQHLLVDRIAQLPEI